MAAADGGLLSLVEQVALADGGLLHSGTQRALHADVRIVNRHSKTKERLTSCDLSNHAQEALAGAHDSMQNC